MRVLYATDGSAHAQAAGRLIAALPLPETSEVRVLTVIGRNDAEEEARPDLASARSVLAGSRAVVSEEVRRGNAAAEILDAAAESGAELLVVGWSGHTAIARFFLGSVAERAARHAPCPVLVVRPGAELREVVFGVDGSDYSRRAASWLAEFPLPPEVQLRLVTVVPLLEEWVRTRPAVPPFIGSETQTLDEQAREEAREVLAELSTPFRAAGREPSCVIRSGDPPVELIKAADEMGADLLVLGAHGMTPVERFLLGSVSDSVLRHAHCSVLIVRPPMETASGS